jgi:murein L,D-transpeptidase YcbB/YkuD
LPVVAVGVALAAGMGCREAAVANDVAAAATAPTGALVAEPRVAGPDEATVAAVDEILAVARHPALTWSDLADVAPDLAGLYAADPDRLLWFDGATPVAATDGAVAAVAASGDHGLDPADYDAAWLQEQWAAMRAGSATPVERAHFDVGLSVAAGRLLRAVRVGRVDPAVLHWGYDIPPKSMTPAAALAEARDGRGLAALVESLAPQFTHYARARTTLRAYKALAASGEPADVPPLPAGTTKITPGQSWEGLPALAARLQVLGDLAADPATGPLPTYRTELVEAVKRFQDRHGLEPDGVIGAGTIRTLNVPIAARIRQIELAMERLRWLPDLGTAPAVFVNVALFRLWASDPASGTEPLRMNVVVGQSLGHQTPLFIDRMRYVVFRPYWNPPRSILVKEIIPKARRDPGYMARQNFEIVASGADDAPALPVTPANLDKVLAGKLSLRQRPGGSNSLGLAKFIFPNAENIYLHGTPAQQLFSRARRDFSHGCIRLEDPAALGAWVLRDQPKWTRARIEQAMNGTRPTRVDLTTPLAVVLFYDTFHVSSTGTIAFMDDIYGHDRALDGALKQGYPFPTKAAKATKTAAR